MLHCLGNFCLLTKKNIDRKRFEDDVCRRLFILKIHIIGHVKFSSFLLINTCLGSDAPTWILVRAQRLLRLLIIIFMLIFIVSQNCMISVRKLCSLPFFFLLMCFGQLGSISDKGRYSE